MANWTTKQVRHWLRENGFNKQTKIFKEKQIDGKALLSLTNDDISQLFIEGNEEGPVGVKSRFRILLREWRMNHQDFVNIDESPRETQPEVIQPKELVKKPEPTKREVMYSIDTEIEIQFFNNNEFLLHFLRFVREENPLVEIEIKRADDSSRNYIVKLIGTKENIRITRRCLKQLLESITYRTYNLSMWNGREKPVELIEKILNDQSGLFTVCQVENQTMKVFYVNHERFISEDYLNRIIQMEIIQEKILRDDRGRIEHRLWKFQICPMEEFDRDLEKILRDYQQGNSSIVIKVKPRSIELFGAKTTVNDVLENLRNFFAKYQLKKHRLDHLSPTERECLINLRWKDLYDYARQFEKYHVRIDVQKNEFIAPDYLKDRIADDLKNFVRVMNSKDFKNLEFYFDLADRVSSDLKHLAQRSRCYCEILPTKKRKSYPIPRGRGNISHLPKTLLEQANQFTGSPSVVSRMIFDQSSIAILIGDIVMQKADVLIVPLTSFGLRESLIERAGSISEKSSSNPMITETTGGDLNYKSIRFVNWSLPTGVEKEEILCESIRLFISKSIPREAKSVAIAMPDWCEEEEIVANEMIEQTIRRIKSTGLKISFVFQPDQSSFYQHFVNTIEKLRGTEEQFGYFQCSVTSLSIRLFSFDEDNLSKCEQRINGYLNRAIFKMKLNGFEHWNQPLINAFYQYSIDRSVLPKLDTQQEILLYGPVSHVYDVHQKYQFINTYIEQIIHLPVGSFTKISTNRYNVLISYSEEDSKIAHRLADRLMEEGFAVSIGLEEIPKKISRSDCVILCLSENYFRNTRCQHQANDIQQSEKPILPIKIQYFQPIDWLKKFIEKESIFHLFGSDNQFNYEYEKILLKLFQYTKPGFMSSVEPSNQMGLICLLTAEQKQIKYEKMKRKMIKSSKGKIPEDEKRNLSETIEDLLQWWNGKCQEHAVKFEDNYFRHLTSSPEHNERAKFYLQSTRFDIGIFSYQQALDKLRVFPTRFNIAPFTFTGYGNDAIFPLLNEVMQNPLLLTFLRKRSYVETGLKDWSVVPLNKRTRRRTKREEQEIVVRKNTRKRKQKRKEYQRSKFSWKPPKGTSRYSESEHRELRSKFAKQLRKNIKEFEEFCQCVPILTRKANPRAIFGPSPFPPVVNEPSKKIVRGPIEIRPLKFPWNGVLNTEIRVVKRRNPLILFSFENESLHKHEFSQ